VKVVAEKNSNEALCYIFRWRQNMIEHS